MFPCLEPQIPCRYLPTDLYNLNSAYGTESELREAINALHDVGLKVIADIVINHRCAQSQVRGAHASGVALVNSGIAPYRGR